MAIESLMDMLGETRTDLLEVPYASLVTDSEQDRSDWDNEATITHIEELSRSIEKGGLDEPLKVRKQEDNYLIFDGECRYRAIAKLNWERVPVIVYNISAEEARNIMLSTQLNKKGLNPIDLANALQSRLDSGWTREDLIERTGKSKSWLSKKLSILDLDDDIQQLAKDGVVLDPVKLKALSKIPNSQKDKSFKGLREGTIGITSLLSKLAKKKESPKTIDTQGINEQDFNQNESKVSLDIDKAKIIFIKLNPQLEIEGGDAFRIQWDDFISGLNNG